ncbi:CsgG/HfaB family protein [Solimonas sp. SE-A11]|uniref:CsgG/HfaB family protein n=1 Tax=Solimonas sp. SE-A11 TaxID=3054954 RepID=UPI00259C7802|nr:CsgG/HfaB family protein [Solimonas sp. SE-A11]MDM4772958.1 CsgG/HfaB family protein [Solimonas sp. SE-A11]
MSKYLPMAFLSAILAVTACKKEAPEAPVEQAPATMAREMPDAGKLEQVAIQATGEGRSVQAAVDQAIQLAVEQVNGKSIDASATHYQAGVAIAVGSENIEIGTAAFQNLVSTRTRGVVSNFKILKQEKSILGDSHKVTIEANIAKFVRPESANRLRLAIAPFRTRQGAYRVDTREFSSEEIARRLRTDLTTALTQTDRFAVLDREFSAEVNAELDEISSGRVASEDFARIGQQLATDYVLVAQLDRFGYERHERALRTSDRVLVSHSGGATLSFRLINVTTNQIAMADQVEIALPATAPTTLGTSIDSASVVETLMKGLSNNASSKVLAKLFPVTVLSVQGNDVVLSQGGSAVAEGSHYSVVLRGQEMKDPQTGQSLGRVEKPCCVIAITKVTPTLSYGQIISSSLDVQKAFQPGALELQGKVAQGAPTPMESVGEEDASDDEPAAAAPAKAQKKAHPAATAPAEAPAAKEDANW